MAMANRWSAAFLHRIVFGLSGCAMVLMTASAAGAGTETDTFNVTASVPDECVVSVDDLDFGSYSVTAGSAVDATTTVNVTCSGGTDYEIALDSGTGSGASVATRKMTSGANTLDYSLYQDASFTQVWGETSGTNTYESTGTGVAQSITIHGQIVGAQGAAAGSYSDTITATISF